MGVKELSVKSGTIYYIKLESIKIEEGWNIREDYGDIQSFAEYILANGINFPPLVGYVENEAFVVVEGHRRRLAALKALEMGADMSQGLPCRIAPKSSSPEERIAQQISSNEGKNYTPLEKALVCKKLASFNWESKKISQATGINLPQVYNYLNYIAPQSENVIQLIRKKEVSISTVIDVAKEVGVKSTYDRLIELNGSDPLLDELEINSDNNVHVITSLDELDELEGNKKEKKNKIKNPSKESKIKGIVKGVINEAEVTDYDELLEVQFTITKKEWELLKELVSAK